MRQQGLPLSSTPAGSAARIRSVRWHLLDPDEPAKSFDRIKRGPACSGAGPLLITSRSVGQPEMSYMVDVLNAGAGRILKRSFPAAVKRARADRHRPVRLRAKSSA